MALPLLKYAPTTQNSRVDPLRVGSDEDPKPMSMDRAMDPKDLNLVIESCAGLSAGMFGWQSRFKGSYEARVQGVLSGWKELEA